MGAYGIVYEVTDLPRQDHGSKAVVVDGMFEGRPRLLFSRDDYGLGSKEGEAVCSLFIGDDTVFHGLILAFGMEKSNPKDDVPELILGHETRVAKNEDAIV